MSHVLIVEDVAALAQQYAYDLKRLGGHETLVAGSGHEALDLLDRGPIDCVILDLELPDIDGFQVLETMRARAITIPVLVYTGTGSYDRCVRAVRLGAFGFLDKGEPIERVAREVENAVEMNRLGREVSELKERFGGDPPLIGSSPAMRELEETIRRLAPIPSAVLILGESGSGKELVARELHRLGKNPRGRFLAVNSAALPENLVESALFGHERGAFTGADRARKGAFEAASGGTLFLDEIGDLPAVAQGKLLRVLEEGRVTRLGSDRSIPAPARVVAATNRNLEDEIDAGRFRADLYHRIGVHVLRVPPLRERPGDVPELARFFLAETCRRFGVRAKRISPEALDALAAYSWEKNNVRELRNVIERMVIACDGEVIEAAGDPSTGSPAAAPAAERAGGTLRERKTAAEKAIVLAALERNGWAITKTARALGLADHSSLLKIMRRHRIHRP